MEAEELVRLFQYSERMKQVPRSGWLLSGVSRCSCESLADHSWATVFISLTLTNYYIEQGIDVNFERVLFLGTIHDFAEAVTTDIPHTSTEYGNPTLLQAKKSAERQILSEIFATSPALVKKAIGAYDELENGTTLESRIVLAADILDMLVHAIWLESSGQDPSTLDDYFVVSEDRLTQLSLDIVQDIYQVLRKKHDSKIKKLAD